MHTKQITSVSKTQETTIGRPYAMISNRRFCAEFLFKNCMIWIDFMQYCQFFLSFSQHRNIYKIKYTKICYISGYRCQICKRDDDVYTYIYIYIYIYMRHDWNMLQMLTVITAIRMSCARGLVLSLRRRPLFDHRCRHACSRRARPADHAT